MFEELVDINHLCKVLKLKKSYVYNLTYSNQIPFYKLGNLLRFKLSDVETWLEMKKNGVVNNAIDY
jgi:excisionase family DNA binding protein